MDHPLDFAVNLALKTGTLLKKYYTPVGLQAKQKSDHTLVTEADLAADQLITTEIRYQFPDDGILSEESSHQISNNSSPTWIIDPIDGTTNFSLGLTIWGISIARIVNGFPEIGVIYFPLIKELYTCQRGNGAYLNNSQLSVKVPDPTQPKPFFTCCSRTFRYYDVSIPYKTRIFGSGAYSFCLVARGAALIGFDADAKIWDLAACWLLVQEAGGMISAFEGSPPFPVIGAYDYGNISYPTLATASDDLSSMAHKRIQRKSKFALVVQKEG